MNKAIHLLLALLICGTPPISAFAAGTRPVDAWSYYHFDGKAFVAGPASDGSAFIAVRDQMRPVILTAQTAHIEEAPLPDGAGVIAGICYLQSSGGKLGSGEGFRPYQRVPLLISSGGKEFVTVQTDDHGYFVVVLAAGTYSIGSGPATAEITVKPDITTLVPLRVGKRMVD